ERVIRDLLVAALQAENERQHGSKSPAFNSRANRAMLAVVNSRQARPARGWLVRCWDKSAGHGDESAAPFGCRRRGHIQRRNESLRPRQFLRRRRSTPGRHAALAKDRASPVRRRASTPDRRSGKALPASPV